LPYITAIEYYESIRVIDAQERLVEMQMADYPRMKAEGRKKMHREMRKAAHPEHLQKKLDFDEFIRKMQNG